MNGEGQQDEAEPHEYAKLLLQKGEDSGSANNVINE